MLLFGYELNFFFNLISFRKSQNKAPTNQPIQSQPQPETHSAIEPAQILSLLAKLSSENEKLTHEKKMIESNNKFKEERNCLNQLKQLKAIEPNVDDENLNTSLANQVDVYIANVNSKEEDYQRKINALKTENEKLKHLF